MGVYKSDSWTKASLFNPLTGDVALMTTLIGGETFLAPQEEITQEITNGNYISQWRHRVQFASSDWDAFDTLKGFKDDHIAVQAVAAAESLNCANLQWYESVQIKELRKVPKARRADGDSHFIVVLEFEGDENAAIFNNVNLLHQTNVNGVVVTGFVDGDANNLADGYSINGAIVSNSFAAGVQTLESDSQYDSIYRAIVFPINNIKFTISSELVSVHPSGTTLGLLSKNKAGTVLSSKFSGVSVGRRNTFLSVTDSTFYTLEARPLDSGASVASAGSASFKEPCLRIDGSSEYIVG